MFFEDRKNGMRILAGTDDGEEDAEDDEEMKQGPSLPGPIYSSRIFVMGDSH